MPERGEEQQLDDAPLELADVRPDVLGDEAEHVVGDRRLEVVLLLLLAQDGDPVLEVGLLDVGDHAPLEPRHQPRLEAGDLLRRPVGGEHDLLAGFVERVEGVEELLLGRFLALEEVDVVDQEEVDVVAVAAAQVGHRPGVDPLDDLVDELLGADVEHPGRRAPGTTTSCAMACIRWVLPSPVAP